MASNTGVIAGRNREYLSVAINTWWRSAAAAHAVVLRSRRGADTGGFVRPHGLHYDPPRGSSMSRAVTSAFESIAGRLSVKGIDLEVIHRGTGPPVLVLHGMQPVDPSARFVDLLARRAEVIVPSHPGFGRSERPADFETVYDLVHLYLDVLEALPHEKITLVGLSFGGWLAAEVAVACGHRLDRLVLVDALGIKISDRETPDILDVFNTSPQEVRRRSWHDPAKWAPDYDAMSDEEIVLRAQGREALCLYGWHPYMYNPRLGRWLHRIKVPTLVLWGASDGIVKPAYGRAYATLIPGSRFELIEGAGHHPEIEQPESFVAHLAGFLAGTSRGKA